MRRYVNIALVFCTGLLPAAEPLPHYYAHPAVADKHGVIAPWYKGQNGQFDLRVRIAAETMKRFPWVTTPRSVMAGPEYIFSPFWKMDFDDRISAVESRNWDNGDLAQRATYVISSLIDYYMYTGDFAALTPIAITADYLIDYCQTPSSHGWPNILISIPNAGKAYGRCELTADDRLVKPGFGKIQLDEVGQTGYEFVRAYELLGEKRWYDVAKHWADLLAENRNRNPGSAPWGRYANNASGRGMNDIMTGGVTRILVFLDELIRTGYRGEGDSIVHARDAARIYLRDVLLPSWTVNDVWGRVFWDAPTPMQDLFGTDFAAVYLLDNKEYFANWNNDVRNILGLFLNHTSANPRSGGDVYHGAWAYPESSGCCYRSLWYGPLWLASTWARYGVEADSEWAREIARRSQVLATYDPRANGESMDLIDGGSYVNSEWFKIAHPMALKYVLRTMSWLPEIMGANRENHILRSSSVVKKVLYEKGKISYSTFDAPAETVDVLRLAYSPIAVMADGKPLISRARLDANGYMVKTVGGGDAIVTIRHDAARDIAITGPDPQTVVDDRQLRFEGNWQTATGEDDYQNTIHNSAQAGASMTFSFKGNQVRLLSRTAADGGLADVFIDDVKQLVPIDCYGLSSFGRQILHYRNGLDNGPHTIRIRVRGAHNPISKGDRVFVDGIQYSDATGNSGFGEGGGPTDTQRMLFGYTGRSDYIDSKGNAWRPGTEFIARSEWLGDTVAKTWWTMRQTAFKLGAGTPDPELYAYGVHGNDFTVNVTVGPGTYHVRLKFAETQYTIPRQRAMTININGRNMIRGFDVFGTGGRDQPVDLVYDGIQPKNGVIVIHFTGDVVDGRQTEAMVKAIEVGPGDGGKGSAPKRICDCS